MKPILTLFRLALIAAIVFPVDVLAQQPSILGKTDILALVDAAPGMPSSAAQAATRAYGPDIRMYEVPVNLDTLYVPFYSRVDAVLKQHRETATLRAKEGMPSQAQIEQQSRAQVNSNPIVAGMGGIDSLQQMTPAQREAAARQSAANFQQNLMTGGGRNSPGMQAMMQRVMSDPGYRARFMQMNEQEKEAELRGYMGNPAPRAPTPAEQRSQTKNDVATAMALRNELSQMTQRLGEIEVTFTKKDQEITVAKGSHREIANDIATRMEKVPIVELGEYGRDRDPNLVVPLLREEGARHRDRAAWELQQRTALFSQRKAQYKEQIAAYRVWFKQNEARINACKPDLMRGPNPELEVAGFEEGLIGLAQTLAKYSESATKDAAHYEKAYQASLTEYGAARSSRPTKSRN